MAQDRDKIMIVPTLRVTIFLLAAILPGRAQQPVAAPQSSATAVGAKEDLRTSKQKQLADEAQRLVAMATELKVEVDKTNKNILSLQVVRKAEEIEVLAHRMKDEGKK